MRNYSSIQVSNETKYRLKGLALTRTETYENILLRLLNTKLHGREIDYQINDKNSDNQLKVKIDWGRQSQNILYYDEDGDLKKDFPEPHTITPEWELFKENILKLDNLINIRNLCVVFAIIKGRFSIFDTFLFPHKNKSSIFASKRQILLA